MANYESEKILEDKIIDQLVKQGYEKIDFWIRTTTNNWWPIKKNKC